MGVFFLTSDTIDILCLVYSYLGAKNNYLKSVKVHVLTFNIVICVQKF